MKLIDGRPRRKGKPKENPLERLDVYLQLKAIIAGGKMKPQEIKTLILDASDGNRLGLKFPARAAADSLRRFLRGSGLASDYRVIKYETDSPGVWAVSVSYEPPMIATKPARRGA